MRRRFTKSVLAAIEKDKILGLKAGSMPHRFIGLWAVVVQGRVFIRSWSLKPRSWYRTFQKEPKGAIQAGDVVIKVRAVFTRSEKLKDAIDKAYLAKYNTPGSIKYVRDLSRKKSRDSTTELVPL